MTTNLPDLNLLPALAALLDERSVTRAAERLRVTVPAMSRTLGRLRAALGDELLVRAGRELVLTPAAAAMVDRVRVASSEALGALRPPATTPLSETARTLVLRCSDAVAALLAMPLERARLREAPLLRLRFAHEGDEDAVALREGRVDLDVGVIDLAAPEVVTRRLATDRFVGVARAGHPLVTRVTTKTFAAARHVSVSRRGRAFGPIDAALHARGLARAVAVVVPDFLVAFHAVASSSLVAAAPALLAAAFSRRLGLASFPLPVPAPPVTIGMAWHPRVSREPAHEWLRAQVQARLGAGASAGGAGR
ncbi:MAG: LysR family transcriptional regulator [Myxococcaceae bacterium]|jgi:DNA-binding transcriptional LysR family regulator|nr:LysR family transcriptional regulator [Myxococcaceae bacterium]MCA3014325.1 LysR family transcriptional regulator [Myxococcaceae bacterium]